MPLVMNKPLIGIFGRTNVGKSSLINFLTAQGVSIVSPQGGTTTDPVRKGFEVQGFSAVTFVDTAGIDDSSPLGDKRVEKSLALVGQVDLALLVTDGVALTLSERGLLERFGVAGVPCVVVYNDFRERTFSETISETISGTIPKTISGTIPGTIPGTFSGTISETISETILGTIPGTFPETIPAGHSSGEVLRNSTPGSSSADALAASCQVSSVVGLSKGSCRVEELRGALAEFSQVELVVTSLTGSARQILEAIKRAIPESALRVPSFFGGKAKAKDFVVMVCPIDSQAPAGRLILPQVQAIRSALDQGVISIVVQPEELEDVLKIIPCPRLIVTDSQLFGTITPPQGVELTSFSILLSQLKGDPEIYTNSLKALDELKSGDKILIFENCSHQTSCDDIGRVKIPNLISAYSGIQDLQFQFLGPRDPMPRQLDQYHLAIQCGGCMVTRGVVQNRIRIAKEAGVPITNYGMAIRYVTRGR